MSEPECDGERLGRMLASEPQLTTPKVDEAGKELIRRFVDFVTAGGFDSGAIVTRMERLKFETIITGKTYGQALADLEEP